LLRVNCQWSLASVTRVSKWRGVSRHQQRNCRWFPYCPFWELSRGCRIGPSSLIRLTKFGDCIQYPAPNSLATPNVRNISGGDHAVPWLRSRWPLRGQSPCLEYCRLRWSSAQVSQARTLAPGGKKQERSPIVYGSST